jgi:antitoxin component HigA of HigAB toxin-antitoxin module
MNSPVLTTEQEYELAARELAELFDCPPEPGSPAAACFELLIRLLDEYENKQMPA